MTDKKTEETDNKQEIELVPSEVAWLKAGVEETTAKKIEKILVSGNIKDLNDTDRINYLKFMAHRYGLDPLSQPFYISRPDGNGNVYLGRKKGCNEQLRQRRKASCELLSEELVEIGGILMAKARARCSDLTGRFEDDIGVVHLAAKGPQDIQNAVMAAATKAKNRATGAFLGLGMLDESEMDFINKQYSNGEGPKRVRPEPTIQVPYSTQRAVPTAVPTDQLPPPPGPAKAPSAVIPTAKPKA